MAKGKKTTINEKEVFNQFLEYDLKKLLVNYPYTEAEKKDKDTLLKNLRIMWEEFLIFNKINPNGQIKNEDAPLFMLVFILRLNGADNNDTIGLPENNDIIREALKSLGLGANKQPDRLIKKSMALSKFIVSVQHSSEPQFSLFYGLNDQNKKIALERYREFKGGAEVESIPFKNFETGHLELIDVFSELVQLHSSNTTDIDKKNYYTGEANPVNKNGDTPPEVFISYYQLAKHFAGIDRPSSSAVNKVKKLVRELEQNPEYHLVTINKRIKKKGSKTETFTYVEASPIVKEIAGVLETKDSNTKESTKEGFRGIKLNPIFAKDLATRYLLEPFGFRLQMKAAVKKIGINKTGQLTRALIILAKYLSYQKTINRNKNNGCFHTERLSLLLPKLNIKLIEQRKNKRLIKQLEDALKVLKEVDLITSSEYTLSVDGEKMLKIELNKNWGSIAANESKVL
jgi:hypothetical protein